MSISDLFEDVGKEGLFQVLVIATVMSTQMPILWGLTMMSYASYEPDWCCAYANPELHPNDSCVTVEYVKGLGYNGSVVYGQRPWIHTDDVSNCDGIDMALCYTKKFLDDKQASTAVTEWDLTCDRDWIVKLISSIQMIGVLIGALVSGAASDWFGRKGIYIASLFAHAVFNLLAASSDSWETFAVYRFFIGMSIGFFLVVNFPYVIEFLSPRWRSIPSTLPIGTLGASALPLCAWLVPDWMWVHIATGLFTAVLMLAALFVPESLRWLTVKGRAGEALEVATTIARVNGKMEDFDSEKVFGRIKKVFQSVQRKKAEESKTYSYLDVYRTRKIAWLTLRLQFLWFSNALISYGVIFDVDGLAGDIYTNMFIVSIVDVPVSIISYYACKRAGQKWVAVGFSTLATIGSIVALASVLISIPGHQDIVTAMCVTVKALMAGGTFSVIAVMTSEMYPTVLRSFGVGATNVAAKIGGIIAPFVFDMKDMASVSFSITLTMCAMSAFIILTMEEAKDTATEDGEGLNSSSYRSQRSSFHQSLGSSIIHSYHQEEDYDDEYEKYANYNDHDLLNDNVHVNTTNRSGDGVKFLSENRSPTDNHRSDEPLLPPEVYRSYGSVSSTNNENDLETRKVV